MRKLLVGLVIAFALFYLLSQPQGAAVAVKGATAAVGTAFQNIVEFLTALFA